MPRPRTISDEVLLARVRGALLEHGPRASLELLAAAAGLSGPGLLRRFGTRDALVVKSLQLSRPAFVDLLAAGPDERPLADQLRDILTAIDAFFTSMLPRMTALRECGCAPSPAVPKLGRASLVGWLQRAHARGLAGDIDVEAAAHLLFGSVFVRAFFIHVVEQRAPRPATADQLDAMVSLCTAALAPAPPRSPPVPPRRRSSSRRSSRSR